MPSDPAQESFVMQLKKPARFLTWSEVSGALGDLGTFLPLLVGMSQKVGLDLGWSLIFTGFYNIASGMMFGIPMAVQPMKTIAALAISGNLTLEQALAAGMFVSLVVLLLGVTRLIDVFNALVPTSIVRGIQLSVGLKLAIKGAQMAFIAKGSGATATLRPFWGPESILLATATLLYLLISALPESAKGKSTEHQSVRHSSSNSRLETAFQPLRCQLNNLKQQLVTAWGFGGSTTGSETTASASKQYCLLRMDSSAAGMPQNRVSDGIEAGEQLPLLNAPTDSKSADSSQLPISIKVVDDSCQQDQNQNPSESSTGNHLSKLESVSAPISCGNGGGAKGRFAAPSALIIVSIGVIMAMVMHPEALSQLRFGPSIPQLFKPTWAQVRAGILKAGLPQLPLTTLNSVVAVTQLATASFPDKDPARWKPSKVAVSVGVMNLIGAWLGAMPVCHGCGGLAAQMRFGARTGAAPVMLGCLKLGLGLLLGSSLLTLLALLPAPLLGAMLVVSGMELASTCKQERCPRGVVFMLLTATVGMALDNALAGFLAGMLAASFTAVMELVIIPAVQVCKEAIITGMQ